MESVSTHRAVSSPQSTSPCPASQSRAPKSCRIFVSHAHIFSLSLSASGIPQRHIIPRSVLSTLCRSPIRLLFELNHVPAPPHLPTAMDLITRFNNTTRVRPPSISPPIHHASLHRHSYKLAFPTDRLSKTSDVQSFTSISCSRVRPWAGRDLCCCIVGSGSEAGLWRG